MYRSFTIKNFRCFEELELENIQRVNLIAGLNNVGKTALLEALFLHGGEANPLAVVHLNALRMIGGIKMELMTNLFFRLDVSREVLMDGIDDKKESSLLRFRVLPQRFTSLKISETQITPDISRESADYGGLEFEYEGRGETKKCRLLINTQGNSLEPAPSPPLFPVCFLGTRMPVNLSEEADRFSSMEIKKQQNLLIQALRIIEPKLQRIALITRGGQAILHGDIGADELMPLSVMGDGMVRICSIVLAIANAPNGVVLIDEVENGLHHSVLEKLMAAIGDIARRFNSQIFATTHSYECISAAHRAFSESPSYDFALYRLEMIKGKIKAVAYNQERLESTIESEWEVR